MYSKEILSQTGKLLLLATHGY